MHKHLKNNNYKCLIFSFVFQGFVNSGYSVNGIGPVSTFNYYFVHAFDIKEMCYLKWIFVYFLNKIFLKEMLDLIFGVD